MLVNIKANTMTVPLIEVHEVKTVIIEHLYTHNVEHNCIVASNSLHMVAQIKSWQLPTRQYLPNNHSSKLQVPNGQAY